MLSSVRAAGGERNRAIASLLAQFGYLEAEETALDTYNHVCCLSGTIADSALGMLLVQCQKNQYPEHRRPHDHLRFVPGICVSQCRWDFYQVRGKRCAYFCGAETGSDRLLSPALDQVGNSKAGLFCCSSSRRL